MISEPQKEILIKLGRRIASLRKSKNLSFRKMALYCDLDYSDIKKFEKGEVNITFLTLVELAKGLDVPLKELMDF
jgi:transcriptional regulator with XRE-family HTH domain